VLAFSAVVLIQQAPSIADGLLIRMFGVGLPGSLIARAALSPSPEARVPRPGSRSPIPG